MVQTSTPLVLKGNVRQHCSSAVENFMMKKAVDQSHNGSAGTERESLSNAVPL